MDYDLVENLLAERKIILADLSKVETAIAGAIAGKAKTNDKVSGAEDDRKLSREEAAEMIGVSVGTMHSWAANGKGPKFKKDGRSAVYKLSAVNAFKESYVPNARAR